MACLLRIIDLGWSFFCRADARRLLLEIHVKTFFWILRGPVMPLFKAMLMDQGLPTRSLNFWVSLYGGICWFAFGVAAWSVFEFLYEVLGG